MKILIVLLAGLLILACLVPHSSTSPDAIQHVLRLAGGVESAPKAILGIAVAAGSAWCLALILKKVGKK